MKKMRMVFIFALLLVASVSIKASSISEPGALKWNQVFGGSKFDVFFSVVEAKNGDIIAAGFTESNADGELTDPNNGPERDALLVRFDANGNKIWDQVFGGNGLNDRDMFQSVIEKKMVILLLLLIPILEVRVKLLIQLMAVIMMPY